MTGRAAQVSRDPCALIQPTGDLLQGMAFTAAGAAEEPRVHLHGRPDAGALGLCASLGDFAFVDAALLRPRLTRCPLPAGWRLRSGPGDPQSNLSYAGLSRWKSLNKVRRPTRSRCTQKSGLTLTAPGAQRVPGARVSDDFFRMSGCACN